MSFSDDVSDREPEPDVDDNQPVTVVVRGEIATLLQEIATHLGQPVDAVASVAVVALAERIRFVSRTERRERSRGQA
jgi:hypothetical protein